MRKEYIIGLLFLLLIAGCNEQKIVENDLLTTINNDALEADIYYISDKLVRVEEDPFFTGSPLSDNPRNFYESGWLGDYWVYDGEEYLWHVPQLCVMIATKIDWPVAGRTYEVEIYRVTGEIVRDIFGDEVRIPIDREINCFRDVEENENPVYRSEEGECCTKKPMDDMCLDDVELMLKFPYEEFTEEEQELMVNKTHSFKHVCGDWGTLRESTFTDIFMGPLSSVGCNIEVQWFSEDEELRQMVEEKGYKTYVELTIPCFKGTYLDVYCGEAKEECNCGFRDWDLVCG